MLFRLLENSADPFRPDDRGHAPGTPPATVRRFLTREFRPLRAVVLLALATTIAAAAIEVWLIGYAGRLVDLLATADRDRFWAEHGRGLLVAAVLVLIVRPLMHVCGEGLDDIAFRVNAQSLARWRLHRYVSRQSVGWFRDELAGRDRHLGPRRRHGRGHRLLRRHPHAGLGGGLHRRVGVADRRDRPAAGAAAGGLDRAVLGAAGVARPALPAPPTSACRRPSPSSPGCSSTPTPTPTSSRCSRTARPTTGGCSPPRAARIWACSASR